MSSATTKRICLVPQVSGVGGMVTFYHRFSTELASRGYTFSNDLSDRPYSSVLVIGGTRQLAALWQARQRGVRIVQRLDGMNWLHRVKPQNITRPTNLRHFLRAEYRNRLLWIIRRYLADHVVYQSQFVRSWWERVYGATLVPSRVVYNGVDLKKYTPWENTQPPTDRYRLLMVEGSMMGGYEIGLEVGIRLAQALADRLKDARNGLDGKRIELLVVGQVTQSLRMRWKSSENVSITWVGAVSGDQIPEFDRSAHLLFSADINPACPNSVIEALACGLPVLAFDTGALPEMVTGDAGRIIPYGGDPWKLDQPDIQALASGAIDILVQQTTFQRGARRCAEQAFGLERMVDGYIQALFE
jgi:glycosyltransferase involved in cell wall biosynthesis